MNSMMTRGLGGGMPGMGLSGISLFPNIFGSGGTGSMYGGGGSGTYGGGGSGMSGGTNR
jgi:hypothetical protein